MTLCHILPEQRGWVNMKYQGNLCMFDWNTCNHLIEYKQMQFNDSFKNKVIYQLFIYKLYIYYIYIYIYNYNYFNSAKIFIYIHNKSLKWFFETTAISLFNSLNIRPGFYNISPYLSKSIFNYLPYSPSLVNIFHIYKILCFLFLFAFFCSFWSEIFLDKQTEHKFYTIFLISQMTQFKKTNADSLIKRPTFFVV